MPIVNKFTSFLENLSKVTGIDNIALDEKGMLVLSIENIIVSFHYYDLADDLYLIANLYCIDYGLNDENKIKQYQKILNLNCFFNQVDDGVLGIPDKSNQVFYTKKLHPCELEYSEFEKTLFAYVKKCQELKAKLNEDAEVAENSQLYNNFQFLEV